MKFVVNANITPLKIFMVMLMWFTIGIAVCHFAGKLCMFGGVCG